MDIRTSAFRGVAILSLTALGMAACDKKDVINIPPPPEPAVEVTVAPTIVSIPVGGTATAAAVVKNSTNQSVTLGDRQCAGRDGERLGRNHGRSAWLDGDHGHFGC